MRSESDGLWRNAEGQIHREDGPAVEYNGGGEAWYYEGKLHREEGPAMSWADGTEHWYRHGKKHRDDGPAVKRADGCNEWWIDDVQVNEKEFAAEYEQRERLERKRREQESLAESIVAVAQKGIIHNLGVRRPLRLKKVPKSRAGWRAN